MIRYKSLSIEFNEICCYASMTYVGYLKLKGYISQFKSEMTKLSGNFEEKRGRWSTEKRNAIIIKDPLTVRLKVLLVQKLIKVWTCKNVDAANYMDTIDANVQYWMKYFYISIVLCKF